MQVGSRLSDLSSAHSHASAALRLLQGSCLALPLVLEDSADRTVGAETVKENHCEWCTNATQFREPEWARYSTVRNYQDQKGCTKMLCTRCGHRFTIGKRSLPAIEGWQVCEAW